MNAADKIKCITLSNDWGDIPARPYRVEAIINSTEFEPGEFLTHEQVVKLCNTEGWTVHIVRRHSGERTN